MSRNHLEKFEDRYILKEGWWEFIKGVITGKVDFSDVGEEDLKSDNELRKSVAQLEKWGKTKYPYGPGTWAEHLKKNADEIRSTFTSNRKK